MTTTARVDPSILKVDSQALVKSYTRNIRVILLITGTFIGFVMYGFAQGTFGFMWIVLTVLGSLLMLAFVSSFLLKSMFVDKSLESLLRSKRVTNA